jgi:hypothetical protein
MALKPGTPAYEQAKSKALALASKGKTPLFIRQETGLKRNQVAGILSRAKGKKEVRVKKVAQKPKPRKRAPKAALKPELRVVENLAVSADRVERVVQKESLEFPEPEPGPFVENPAKDIEYGVAMSRALVQMDEMKRKRGKK